MPISTRCSSVSLTRLPVAELLALSTREGAHGLPALAHATSSTWNVVSQCHLVFGAVGFTLEFPMQRYSRRAKALGSFVDGWVDQRTGCALYAGADRQSAP